MKGRGQSFHGTLPLLLGPGQWEPHLPICTRGCVQLIDKMSQAQIISSHPTLCLEHHTSWGSAELLWGTGHRWVRSSRKLWEFPSQEWSLKPWHQLTPVLEEGREKGAPAEGWMKQGDVRGMQKLQPLKESSVQTLYFLSSAKNNFMSLSEQTTTSGAYCFRNHVYAWTLYLNFFWLLIKTNVINLEKKTHPRFEAPAERLCPEEEHELCAVLL